MAYKAGCIFCDIAQGKSPANVEFQDDKVIAFYDLNPKTPTHILVIPKDHLTSLRLATDSHIATLGWMVLVAKRIAEKKGLDQEGYRLTLNTGSNSGAIVDHIHLHLLGGRKLGPMG